MSSVYARVRDEVRSLFGGRVKVQAEPGCVVDGDPASAGHQHLVTARLDSLGVDSDDRIEFVIDDRQGSIPACIALQLCQVARECELLARDVASL